MKVVWILMFLMCFLITASARKRSNELPYDYSATLKCLTTPHRAQHRGGIITNPEFSHGLEGWTMFGRGGMRHGESEDGRNRYIIAHSRTQSVDSISQTVQIEEGKLYIFSAWIQIGEGSEDVAVVFRTGTRKLINGGKVTAKKGCWSLLKGGIFANFSGPTEVLFESKTTTEIMVDSISLQPFTLTQWRSHQDENINQMRKSRVRFRISYANGTAAEGARVYIDQTKPHFPFGCGMNYNILGSTDYQTWFASRFKYTTFTNEMKWYSTEKIRGEENYTIADAMLKFTKQNGIHVRGHNIFWDNPKQQPNWVKNLSAEDLQEAATRRLNSVVRRYSGQLIAWDVVNENLHFSFFEDKLGKNASAEYFLRASQLDPTTIMFMNEYNTIENSHDQSASPSNYMKKLEEIRAYPGNQRTLLGIGLQSNFGSEQPNLAYMRTCLDLLGSTGLPIWLTEVSVEQGPNQAQYLEEILREGYSHPAVKGIIMFAGPEMAGFNKTMLVNRNFENTPNGDVVDNLIKEWGSNTTKIKTDNRGYFEVSLFHGDYNITVEQPVTPSLISTFSYKVRNDVTIRDNANVVHFQL